MSAPAKAKRKTRRPPSAERHIHLPSVHVRGAGGTGYDYDEDLYCSWPGQITRKIRFVTLIAGEPARIRETVDVLSEEDLEGLEDVLPVLMDEANPVGQSLMEESARRESARQFRIAAGVEAACARCGCSESRACSGGCIWVHANLCSRCA